MYSIHITLSYIFNTFKLIPIVYWLVLFRMFDWGLEILLYILYDLNIFSMFGMFCHPKNLRNATMCHNISKIFLAQGIIQYFLYSVEQGNFILNDKNLSNHCWQAFLQILIKYQDSRKRCYLFFYNNYNGVTPGESKTSYIFNCLR